MAIALEEEQRATAETARATVEGERVTAETARATAETNRADAESSRGTAESARETAEVGRVFAETARATAEGERAEAETARIAAENQRAEDTTERLENADNAVDRLNALSDHRDKIVDGYWWRWNEATGQYEKTGYNAGLSILAYYDTEALLRAGVNDPNPGDAYGVGTAAPYDIFIYDGTAEEWVNNGPLQGLPGGGSGNVLVETENLEAGKRYLFTPDVDGSPTGTFEEYVPPTIPAQVQSDWGEADPASPAYIDHKPTIPSQTEIDGEITTLSDRITANTEAIATKTTKAYVDAAEQAMSDRIDLLVDAQAVIGQEMATALATKAAATEITRIDEALAAKADDTEITRLDGAVTTLGDQIGDIGTLLDTINRTVV